MSDRFKPTRRRHLELHVGSRPDHDSPAPGRAPADEPVGDQPGCQEERALAKLRHPCMHGVRRASDRN